MWCWHRIRESESGLCPACRTPYGEDPHQFSAVDVEDVLKANKIKEAAAKKEREKQRELSDNDDVAAMPVPSDRTQLANMRVIRRNLVYAVGLPVQIAVEDVLKKAEYFGQYGKISKIVINRAQTQGTDPRRATASAYVTFAHKEDTLACILALDGFYLENRNIRASYGTSKYCSAFIKNVRCNNPECTYLHEMGAAEDTFTKQEIQAGYVTSGRDVLARQQQIVAEQLRLGAVGGTPRKRIGGGGPSNTGKPSNSPIFPPPEYDEPAKPAPIMVPPPSGSIGRALTTGGMNAGPMNPSTVPAKLGRAATVTSTSNDEQSPVLESVSPPLGLAAQRKVPATTAPGTTAASVVAGMRSVKSDVLESHTTLTPLTPLKRNSKATRSATGAPLQPVSGELKLNQLRNGASKKQHGIELVLGSSGSLNNSDPIIGGDLIGPPALVSRSANLGPGLDALGSLPAAEAPVSLLGGQQFLGNGMSNYNDRASSLGGEVFTGHLPNNSAIGSSKDKWNTSGASAFGANDMWSNGGSSLSQLNSGHSAVGGSVIGSAFGGNVGGSNNNSSSTLASILGISLPTGNGSLASFGDQWMPAAGPSQLSALNGSGVQAHDMMGGHQSNIGGSSLIGGVPIGSGSMGSVGAIGGNNSNKNDIALLQSLLPGVHITSGGSNDVFGNTASGWNNGGSPSVGQGGEPVGGGQGNPQMNQRRGQGIW
jgi:CCR4-NOT transcription complex subunit 4